MKGFCEHGNGGLASLKVGWEQTANHKSDRITLQCEGIFMISVQTQGGKIRHSFPGVSQVKQ